MNKVEINTFHDLHNVLSGASFNKIEISQLSILFVANKLCSNLVYILYVLQLKLSDFRENKTEGNLM